MLKKTILISLFLSFNKSYSMDIGGFFKKGLDFFTGNNNVTKDENIKDENIKDNVPKEENKEEILEFKLKMKDIEKYKYYDKINQDLKDKLKVEENKEKFIKLKINKTDINEDKIKDEIITKLNIGDFINKEDIDLNLEKKYLKFFTKGDNSFSIKNLIITKTIEEIEKLKNELNCEINKENKDNYINNFSNFKEKVKKLENNNFYSEYHKTLDQEVENISKKIIDFSSKNPDDKQTQTIKNIEEKIDSNFAFIFEIDNFESLEDNKKKEVNDIRNKENFEKICNEILKKYTIDDILKIIIDDKKNKKFTEIKEHLDEMVTKIEFKIKDDRKLKQIYSKKFNDIVKEYKEGKLETIYYNDIFNILNEFKLERTEKIKFYYKTDNGYEEITPNKENNKFFEKNVNNIIYVEFPSDFYSDENNDDDIEEETEETEENKEKVDKGETKKNKDVKAKKICCSQNNDSKNKSKEKRCSGK